MLYVSANKKFDKFPGRKQEDLSITYDAWLNSEPGSDVFELFVNEQGGRVPKITLEGIRRARDE
jgi:hypothetical protein